MGCDSNRGELFSFSSQIEQNQQPCKQLKDTLVALLQENENTIGLVSASTEKVFIVWPRLFVRQL